MQEVNIYTKMQTEFLGEENIKVLREVIWENMLSHYGELTERDYISSISIFAKKHFSDTHSSEPYDLMNANKSFIQELLSENAIIKKDKESETGDEYYTKEDLIAQRESKWNSDVEAQENHFAKYITTDSPAIRPLFEDNIEEEPFEVEKEMEKVLLARNYDINELFPQIITSNQNATKSVKDDVMSQEAIPPTEETNNKTNIVMRRIDQVVKELEAIKLILEK
jgi:hypothetical protein|tara:strand:- start:341 stop:1012 length:672 start_codon:yes stop_codon:yes gene_type:complete